MFEISSRLAMLSDLLERVLRWGMRKRSTAYIKYGREGGVESYSEIVAVTKVSYGAEGS
jgi:hypothetical protein